MHNTLKWFWLPVMALVLAGCGGSDNDDETNDEQPTPAAVRVMPVAPHAPALSILVDTTPEDDAEGTRLSDLQFGQLTGFSVPQGVSPRLTLRYSLPAGAGPEREYEPVLEPLDIETSSGTRHQLFIGGEYPDAETWIMATPITFEESEEQARITLVNAAASAGELDVHLTAEGAPIDSSTLISGGLAYQEGDSAVRVDEGDYQVRVTQAGDDAVIYSSKAFPLSAGDDTTLVALENAWRGDDAPPIVMTRSTAAGGTALMFGEDSGARLRVVHASSYDMELDVILDGDFAEPFAQDLLPGAITDYKAIDAGVHTVEVAPANGANAAISTRYNFFNGVDWVMFIMRPWDFLDPLFASENARSIDAYARLRVVNASEEAGTVDVYITEPGADLGELDEDGVAVYQPIGAGFGVKRVSTFLPIDDGFYDVTFTQTMQEGEEAPDAPEVVYGPVRVEIVDGEVYTLMLRDTTNLTVTHNWLGTSAESVPEPPAEEE